MCTPEEHRHAKLEMEAYDALPKVVRDAFDAAPMKVSVYNTMRLPGFQRAYASMTAEDFAATITTHFKKEAATAHAQDQVSV